MKVIGFTSIAIAAAIATPAIAQDAAPGFDGIYVGAAGGFDMQPNDAGSGVSFDRDLDGRFGDTVLTPTGANAYAPGFRDGRARDQFSLGNGGSCANDKDDFAYYRRVGFDAQRGPFVVGVVASSAPAASRTA